MDELEPPPWIWPIVMSPDVGTCWTISATLRVCVPPLPSTYSFRLTSSVRACLELGVVAPLAGAQKTRPVLFCVSHGDTSLAGLSWAAAPHWQPDESTGRVSFQPDSDTAARPEAAAGTVVAVLDPPAPTAAATATTLIPVTVASPTTKARDAVRDVE